MASVRRRSGTVRLRLDAAERRVLADLVAQVAALLEDPESTGAADPVWQRLLPAGSRDDDAAAADFRAMTEEGLRSTKRESLGTVTAALTADTSSRSVSLAITDEALPTWLYALNDVRLALGVRLGVTDDGPVGADPAEAAIYDWLTWLQESLVHAVADT